MAGFLCLLKAAAIVNDEQHQAARALVETMTEALMDRLGEDHAPDADTVSIARTGELRNSPNHRDGSHERSPMEDADSSGPAGPAPPLPVSDDG